MNGFVVDVNKFVVVVVVIVVDVVVVDVVEGTLGVVV